MLAYIILENFKAFKEKTYIGSKNEKYEYRIYIIISSK